MEYNHTYKKRIKGQYNLRLQTQRKCKKKLLALVFQAAIIGSEKGASFYKGIIGIIIILISL